MRTSRFVQDLDSGPQVEMIGVVQDQIYPKGFDLLWRETLYRSLGGYGHERRQNSCAI